MVEQFNGWFWGGVQVEDGNPTGRRPPRWGVHREAIGRERYPDMKICDFVLVYLDYDNSSNVILLEIN